jgi:acetoacetyl-CoA synthase
MTGPAAIWVPDAAAVRGAAVTAFARWCVAERGAPPAAAEDYAQLWRWSVAELPAFWAAVGEYFGIVPAGHRGTVVSTDPMPATRWFPGVTVNYVERIFRDRPADQPAVIDLSEGTDRARTRSWAQLRREVAALAATLRRLGVTPGDRVVGYLPNVAEGVVAFLATASIGAVWASCGQDYPPPAAADRFGQLAPVVLVAADGYRFAGREHDRAAAVAELRRRMPTVRATVLVPRLGGPAPDTISWAEATSGEHDLVAEPLPFDHPLWVLFSSGTTGRPKGIVHGHGGILLEHSKVLGLHNGLGPGDRLLWYTTPSWMVWNYVVSGLLVGATILCYAGSPSHPGPDALWALAARHGVTFLGTSPGYLAACEKAGAEPGRDHDLRALRVVGSSGSHLPATSYTWVAEHVDKRVQVASTSGGTDVVSAFAGATPTLPVWPGELSAPCLGAALEAWDPTGRPLRGRMGELVITRLMPSMPLHLWDDPDGSRYRAAYFDVFPGTWRHGDWVTITDHGTVVVHGRSDSTLNRNGVRMGSAEINRAAETVPEIAEAMVIGAEQPDGDYWMPLFVQLAPGAVLDATVRDRIRAAIRDTASPRHLPDEIRAVPGIPHTRTGKKLEVPVKRLLQGSAVDQVVDPGAVDGHTLLEWFRQYREERRTR